MNITIEQLRAICPKGPRNIDVFIPYLNKYMNMYGITTLKRAAAFIAQIAHETGQFRYMREIGSGAKYDTGKLAKTLGNTPEADGDGQRTKGRGGFMITGTDNYKEYGEAMGVDLIKTPELLETPMYAIWSACLFWVKIKGNSLMDLPDTWRSNTHKYSPFQYTTYRINGGQNGSEDRAALYKVALKVLV